MRMSLRITMFQKIKTLSSRYNIRCEASYEYCFVNHVFNETCK